MEEFEKELNLIDNKYPFVIPDKENLACLVIGEFILIIGAVVLLWLFIIHRGQISTIVNSAPKFPNYLVETSLSYLDYLKLKQYLQIQLHCQI